MNTLTLIYQHPTTGLTRAWTTFPNGMDDMLTTMAEYGRSDITGVIYNDTVIQYGSYTPAELEPYL